jgi:hypothetical protein
MSISVTQLRLVRFIPLGLHEISNVLQQGMQKKGSKATVGAKKKWNTFRGKIEWID